jgi:hypothetical protein
VRPRRMPSRPVCSWSTTARTITAGRTSGSSRWGLTSCGGDATGRPSRSNARTDATSLAFAFARRAAVPLLLVETRCCNDVGSRFLYRGQASNAACSPAVPPLAVPFADAVLPSPGAAPLVAASIRLSAVGVLLPAGPRRRSEIAEVGRVAAPSSATTSLLPSGRSQCPMAVGDVASLSALLLRVLS